MIAGLIDGAIKRRKVVLGVTVIAMIFGFFAYLSMPREAQPEAAARQDRDQYLQAWGSAENLAYYNLLKERLKVQILAPKPSGLDAGITQ